MKNVGIIVDNDFNSDIRVRKEVEILKKTGLNIFVLCFAFDNKTYTSIQGVKVHRINIKKKTKDILFFIYNRIPFYELLWKREIKKFIETNSIDVLHVHDLYMSKPVALATKCQKLEIPLILDLHENFPYAIQAYNWTKGRIRGVLSNPKAWLKKESKYLRYASKLIVLSESYKQELLDRYDFLDEKNIVSFPNVIDFRKFETYNIDPEVKKSDKITFMYFGGVAERRGIFDVLTVFSKEETINLNIELLIIGPLDKADKQRFFNEINNPLLKKRIHYIPWIEVSELVTYMHISDVFLSPLKKNQQHESGVANKIFQYMYGGKPIIVSDCKPQKELIELFNCGLSYSTQKEFLSCIKKLTENKDLREKLGANGFENLYGTYDNKDYENVLLGLYDETLTNKQYT